MNIKLEGIIPIVPTPFNAEGAIDLDGLRRVVDFAIDAGASGVCAPAFASEFYKLSDGERKHIAEVIIEQARGRTPVIISTGHGSSRISIEFSRHAEEIGADAIMVTVPRFVSLDATGLTKYFTTIGEAISVPMMIQDADFAGAGQPVDFFLNLYQTVPTFRFAKIEVPLSGAKYTELIKRTEGNVRFFSGLNGMHMLDALGRGVAGIMPGCSALEAFVRIYTLFKGGEPRPAQQLFTRLLPFIVFSMQSIELVNIIEKKVLHRRGVLKSDFVRDPTIHLDDHYLSQIETHIDSVLTCIEELKVQA